MMTSRKGAITLGFAMGAMAKFGMSGATEVGTIFTSKAMDRLANGVQVSMGSGACEQPMDRQVQHWQAVLCAVLYAVLLAILDDKS